MKLAALWFVGLVGCGRIDFDPLAPPGPDTVTLHIVTDDTAVSSFGLPVSGATVLIDRGGDYERTVTDALGTAQFSARDLQTFHVVYRTPYGWRIYTIAIPGATTIQLGGNAYQRNRMSFAMPAGLANDNYIVSIPRECDNLPQAQTPMVTVDYRQVCEGKTVHAFVYAEQTPGMNMRYLDAGNVVLTNGSIRTLTDAYQPVPQRTVQITNLPTGAMTASVEFFLRSGTDLTPVSPRPAAATLQGTTATAMALSTPDGDTLMVQIANTLAPLADAVTTRIVAAPRTTTMSFDAATMLPLFGSYTADSPQPLSMTWTGGGTGGTLIAVMAHDPAATIEWRAYLDPSAIAATFPVLPADLGVPAPERTLGGSITRYDVPGATPASLLRTFDGIWFPPYDDALLPPQGVSITHIEFGL